MRPDVSRHSAGRAAARVLITGLAAIMFSGAAWAADEGARLRDFTDHWAGITALIVFLLAYVCVVCEEVVHLRKSKPVMIAAGVIWLLTALAYAGHGDSHTAEIAVRHNLLEFGELFLFLLAAMTFINTMEDRGIFGALKAWLVSRGFSFRALFWLTGCLAFVMSPIADNLTTALLLTTVIMAVAGDKPAFAALACVNIVVAANAGGAFSPFGDITTLMVWQKGIVEFQQFFNLFVPSLVNWLVPAIIMSFTIVNEKPEPVAEEAELLEGAFIVTGLFIATIAMAVCYHNFLHLPPVIGMMTGLGLLKIYGYWLKMKGRSNGYMLDAGAGALGFERDDSKGPDRRGKFNIFKSLARAEWDTLMFFYGVILCVGGLSALGYLQLVSQLMYVDMGPTAANILVGVLSAIIDNIPVMFAVLSMLPEMNHGQWLLVTLTAGVGGSLLSVGSAAGVAAMGAGRGVYTFFSHLKWTWAIALGYAASVWVHFVVNAAAFSQ